MEGVQNSVESRARLRGARAASGAQCRGRVQQCGRLGSTARWPVPVELLCAIGVFDSLAEVAIVVVRCKHGGGG